MDLREYGAYLRSQRIGQGKGKDEVARAMHIPVELLEAWEDGLRLPTIEQLQLLSAALELPFDQVYPDSAPRPRQGMPSGRIALIIAGAIFALAMTIWSVRSTYQMTGSMEQRAATLMEEMLAASMEREEAQLALAHIAQSEFFLKTGLEKDQLALTAFDNHYAYTQEGMALETEMTFSAGEYTFQVTCLKNGDGWQIADAAAIIPLE